MTQEQINEKALEAYPEKYVKLPLCMNEKDINTGRREGYKRALNDVESLIKVKGWVARSQGSDWVEKDRKQVLIENNYNGELSFYSKKPTRGKCMWDSMNGTHFIISNHGNPTCFEELSWEDEPIEVEILIRKV